jgi:simple sugar transport system ATP-binding protein
MDISDSITVMRQGSTVDRLRTASTTPAEIAKAMVGRDVQLAMDYLADELSVPVERAVLPATTPMLDVRNLVVNNARRLTAVDGVSFGVMPGEILGIAGVEGNGQTELIEAIAGLRAPRAGSIAIGGRDVTELSVKHRGDAGLSHIPEDRHARGLILDYSISENLILGQQHRFTSGVRLNGELIAENARGQIAAFDIRPPDAALAARTLSGGNQQKIVIAREDGTRVSGAARGATDARRRRRRDRFIHARLREAARDSGKPFCLVSADLAEISRSPIASR